MSDAWSTSRGFRDRILDRLRLQFLGAGNWEAALADSGLPDEVTSVIREVVQETGLLRFEKSEITTELIHHFQDGHERDHSFEELVRNFGKTDVAVSLFRSSKLRSRPVSVKAFKGSLAVFGGGIFGYLLLQLFFHSAKPNPTVDYGEKLNQTATSMPVEQRAWPLYRDVWVKHGFLESHMYEELWFYESSRDAPEVLWTDHERHRRLIRPTDENWDAAVAKLESLNELLDVLRKGSKLPFVGAPLHTDKSNYSEADLAAFFPGLTQEKIAENAASKTIIEEFGWAMDPISEEADELLSNSTIAVLLPHIQQFRRAARVLRVDTRYAMEQNDHDRAMRNVEAIFGLGRQAANNPIFVCVLVGAAVQGDGMGLIEELVDEHLETLSNEELKRLQKIMADADFSSMFQNQSTEKEFVLDMVQRIYSDDGNGDGRMTAVGMEVQNVCSKFVSRPGADDNKSWLDKSLVRSLTGPVNLFTGPSRKEMESLVDEAFEQLEKESQLTMWQWLESDFDFETFLKEKDESGFLFGMIGTRGLSQSREVKIARQDAVLLALAIHRFKRSEGEWPTKLDQLTGDWIDRTPIDRLNGKPLHFVIKDDAPVIYSLGHDGDDDGGVNTDSDAPWLDREGDGDWVLWPSND